MIELETALLRDPDHLASLLVHEAALLGPEEFPFLSWLGTPAVDDEVLDRLRMFCATVAVS